MAFVGRVVTIAIAAVAVRVVLVAVVVVAVVVANLMAVVVAVLMAVIVAVFTAVVVAVCLQLLSVVIVVTLSPWLPVPHHVVYVTTDVVVVLPPSLSPWSRVGPCINALGLSWLGLCATEWQKWETGDRERWPHANKLPYRPKNKSAQEGIEPSASAEKYICQKFTQYTISASNSLLMCAT
jgi:hypothetical protein